jgi:nucleoside-diphosphate-sugar epimerase
MKILLTGASGYVGRWVAAELDRRGIVWTSLKSRLEALSQDCLEGSETVIHCAAEHRHSPEVTEQLIWETNLGGTQNLLRVCKSVGVRRFIYVSTIIATDVGAYQESKLAAEDLVRSYNFNYIIFRPGQLFGPCEKFYYQLNDLKKLNWRYRIVLGNGHNKIFPTAYVKDFAAACVDAAQSQHNSKTFTFFDETITEIGYLRAARRALKLKFIIICMPELIATLRIGAPEVRRWKRKYDYDECNKWKYKPTPIEKMLRETYFGYSRMMGLNSNK